MDQYTATTTNHLNNHTSTTTPKSPLTVSEPVPSSINNNHRTYVFYVKRSTSTMLPRLQQQPRRHRLHCDRRRCRWRLRCRDHNTTRETSPVHSKTSCTNIMLTCGHNNLTKTAHRRDEGVRRREGHSRGQQGILLLQYIGMVMILMLGSATDCTAADQSQNQPSVSKRLVSGADGNHNDWVRKKNPRFFYWATKIAI